MPRCSTTGNRRPTTSGPRPKRLPYIPHTIVREIVILTDKAGHLVSDYSLRELHLFARRIGLKRSWFQDSAHPHYDMTVSWRRNRAIKAGAVLVSGQELVRRMCRKL